MVPDKCTTRICGQPAIISVPLISGILGRLRFCTTGEYADGLPFPRQGVLPASCVAAILDGSVVPRRRRCSSALQKAFRVLAAMFFYGVILWHRGTTRSASSVSFCILFLTSQKKYARGATVAVSPHQRHLRCQPEALRFRPDQPEKGTLLSPFRALFLFPWFTITAEQDGRP